MWQNDVGQNDEKTIRDNDVAGVRWQLMSQPFTVANYRMRFHGLDRNLAKC